MNKVKSFKEFINESIWGDINRRSQGHQTRKEDDVNNLDMAGLIEYLRNHYEVAEKYAIENDITDVITHNQDLTNLAIGVVGINERTYGMTMLNLYYKNHEVSFGKYAAGTPMYDKLEKEYIMEDSKTSWEYILKPKSGEVDNKFFLNVLDFIIANVEEPEECLIRKK